MAPRVDPHRVRVEGDEAADVVHQEEVGVDEGLEVGGDAEVWDDVEALLDECAELKFDRATITLDDVHDIGGTARSFLKLCRVCVNYAKPEIANEVLTAAIKKDILRFKAAYTLEDLIKLANWLKSADGTSTMARVHKEVRLRKRGGTELAANEVALAQGLTTMQAELATRIKKDFVEVDAEIVRLRQKIQKMERRKKEIAERHRRDLSPAGRYEGPSENELRNLCYEKYTAECRARNRPAKPKNSMTFEMVQRQYQDKVRMEHQLEFCQEGDNSEKLRRFIGEKILQLRKEGDLKTAGTFRTEYEVMFGEAFDEKTLAGQGPTGERDTGGEDSEPGAEVGESEGVGDSVSLDVLTPGPVRRPVTRGHVEDVRASKSGRKRKAGRTQNRGRKKRRTGEAEEPSGSEE